MDPQKWLASNQQTSHHKATLSNLRLRDYNFQSTLTTHVTKSNFSRQPEDYPADPPKSLHELTNKNMFEPTTTQKRSRGRPHKFRSAPSPRIKSSCHIVIVNSASSKIVATVAGVCEAKIDVVHQMAKQAQPVNPAADTHQTAQPDIRALDFRQRNVKKTIYIYIYIYIGAAPKFRSLPPPTTPNLQSTSAGCIRTGERSPINSSL